MQRSKILDSDCDSVKMGIYQNESHIETRVVLVATFTFILKIPTFPFKRPFHRKIYEHIYLRLVYVFGHSRCLICGCPINITTMSIIPYYTSNNG